MRMFLADSNICKIWVNVYEVGKGSGVAAATAQTEVEAPNVSHTYLYIYNIVVYVPYY